MIKRIIFVFCVLTIFSGICAAKKIYTIGRAPVFKNIGIDIQDMQECLLKNWEDVETILSLGGISHLSQQLNRAIRGDIKAGRVTIGKLYKGTQLCWMAFRHKIKPKGTIALLHRPVWMGKTLDVFYVTIYDGPVTYRFVIPIGCGNLSLKNIEKSIKEEIKEEIKKIEYKSTPVVPPVPPEIVKKEKTWGPYIIGAGALLVAGGIIYSLWPRYSTECPKTNPEDEEPPSGYIPSAPSLYGDVDLHPAPQARAVNIKFKIISVRF